MLFIWAYNSLLNKVSDVTIFIVFVHTKQGLPQALMIWRGTCPPPYGGGQVQGDKAVIGGTDGEGHILYGGTHTSNSF